MEMSIVAGFWVVSFLLIMTPGADWAYAISAGINGRRVVPAVMGLMSGHLLATLIVVAGVGVLIAQHPLALTGLTVAGPCISCGLASAVASPGRTGKGHPACGKLDAVGGERTLH
jgi:threonine/homoserine/homoserine lactone efflux protein